MVDFSEINLMLVLSTQVCVGVFPLTKGSYMPIAVLMAALCSGLAMAIAWMSFGGSGVSALLIYVLGGQTVAAGVLMMTALRGMR